MLLPDCGERGRVTDITAKPTADAHKHVSMCINILGYLFHGYTHVRTQCGDNCMGHTKTECRLVADAILQTVILTVWTPLSKVNRELRPLKPALIC